MPNHVDETCTLVHDMRNQLLRLFGSLSLMETYLEQGQTSDVSRLIKNSMKSAKSLSEMFDQLLADSQAESSGEKAVDVIEAVRLGVDIVIPEKEVFVQWSFPPNLVACGLTRLTLTRMIRNLAENAVRAMQSRGHIFVSGERIGERVRITFADTGPGIPLELRARLFDGGGTEGSGFGLGLPSVREAALKAGGDIRLVDSEIGATFQIDLPAFDLKKGEKVAA